MSYHLPPVLRNKLDLIDRILYLERELEERRFVGSKMSNVMFNLGQKAYYSDAPLFDSLRRQWDKIEHTPKAKIAPIPKPTKRTNATHKTAR